MAGGTMVFGGIVVGPILAVTGYVFASSMEDKNMMLKLIYKALCEAMEAERIC